jgi:hypothetical protein
MSEETAISNKIKVKIIKEYIEPAYIYEIKSMIAGKRCWKITGQVFETISKVFVAVSGILSFSSGYYQNQLLSFLAGSISTISLAMLQFSSFSFKENKKQSNELNILLNKLGLDTMPVFDRNTYDAQYGSKQDQILDNDNLNTLINEIHNMENSNIVHNHDNIVKQDNEENM